MDKKITFKITKDKKLDRELFAGFAERGDSFLLSQHPELKGMESGKRKKVIEALVERLYEKDGKKIKKVSAYLSGKKDVLNEIAQKLSEMMGTGWGEMKTFTIIVSSCPIAPRFLEYRSFVMPYICNQDQILRICTHELSHFLYFKKLGEISPNVSKKEFNYLEKEWVISELVAPLVVNDERIVKITKAKDILYPQWRDVKIGKRGLLEIFEEVNKKSKNFEDFIKLFKKRFDELDKKYSLYKKLIDKM